MTDKEFDDIIKAYGSIAKSEQEQLRDRICQMPLEDKIDFLCMAYAQRIITTSKNISVIYDIFQDYRQSEVANGHSDPRFLKAYSEIKNFLGGVVDGF